MQQPKPTHDENTQNTQTTPTRDPALDKLRRMLADFDDAMLVTSDQRTGMRARPMRIIARSQDTRDDMWFVSSLETSKITELLREPRVAVVLGDHNRFISISGVAEVVVDRARLESMWTENWKLWFPEGTDPSDLALIHVTPQHAEYWDHSSFKTVRVAFEFVKAWVKDEAVDLPKGDPDWHASVTMA